MNHRRPVFAFVVGTALLGSLVSSPVWAETGEAKKALRQADQALTGAVRELGKGVKKAGQAVDRAAKAGTQAVRRTVKGNSE